MKLNRIILTIAAALLLTSAASAADKCAGLEAGTKAQIMCKLGTAAGSKILLAVYMVEAYASQYIYIIFGIVPFREDW